MELSPMLFLHTVHAYQQTELIKTALELDVFTAIDEGNDSFESLAAKCGTSERGMRILCDALVVRSFLTKEENSYRLTPDSAMFLNRYSPRYGGDAIEFLASPIYTEGFKNLTAAVRKGGTAISSEGTMAPDHPIWVEFARKVAPLRALSAQSVVKLVAGDSRQKLKILDLAAGHGLFGIEFAKHNPNAEIVALDWPNVLEVAKENAQTAGVSDRFSTIPGSVFDVDFGSGYDLVLLTAFLDHFDIPMIENILKKVHSALVEGGRAVTLVFVSSSDRISPLEAAWYSLIMLATTPGGEAYTFAEYEQMFSNAGFKHSELNPSPPLAHQLIISYK